jgi:hypothetical protein
MNMSLTLAWTITLGSLAGLVWVLTRLILRRRQNTATPEGGAVRDGFSLARYQPMERLLADDDLAFLKSQPNYRPAMGRRWQRERRRIFRMYLAELKEDFHGLHTQARELVAASGADSAALVDVLMKQHLTFLRATAALEFRLALEQIGIGKADAGPLLTMIEAMRLDLAQRTAAHAV